MSVPEPLRHKGRLEVHVKAQYLASYTIKILSNSKTFPAEVDYVLTDRIKGCALDIYAKAWSANKINAETNSVNREMRYKLQEEAILLCSEMLSYIGVAKQGQRREAHTRQGRRELPLLEKPRVKGKHAQYAKAHG